MAKDEKQDKEVYVTPVGRVINASVFKMNTYTDAKGVEGDPYYTLEMAFDDNESLDPFVDILNRAAENYWGRGTKIDLCEGGTVSAFIDGDRLARNREEKGKEGAAYKGKLVIRAKTKFNADGIDCGGGGIQVYDENVERISPLKAGDFYNGCMAVAGVELNCWVDNKGVKNIGYYLKSVQKTGDGEKLSSSSDHSNLFKPVGRAAGGGEVRRRRAG